MTDQNFLNKMLDFLSKINNKDIEVYRVKFKKIIGD